MILLVAHTQMELVREALHWVAVSYLLGSIPFGYLIVKLREGRDIRGSGSGNIGATNVARSAGPVLGALTLVLDTAKGWLAVWLAGWMTEGAILWMSVAALTSIVGHMFPVWLKFRGGKGVATGLGAFVAINAPVVGVAFLAWLAGVVATRYVSMGSILSAAALPPAIYFFYRPQPAPLALNLAAAAAAVLIIWKHRENMGRIAAGKENRLRFR